MKIIRNDKLIARNGKIGGWISLGALVVLGGGMYISFAKPEWMIVSLFSLILGFILTQVGMFMSSRWGRSPRPDEKLDAGLKGLHSEFNMYHYSSPVPHLLVGPAGVWTVIPYHQRGRVEFHKNRWRLKGGGFLQGYMRIFGQEGLGRPDLEAEAQIQAVRKAFGKSLQGEVVPEVKAVLVFTDSGIEVDAGDSPIPALKLKQLKEFFRTESRNRTLSSDQINHITENLPA